MEVTGLNMRPALLSENPVNLVNLYPETICNAFNRYTRRRLAPNLNNIFGVKFVKMIVFAKTISNLHIALVVTFQALRAQTLRAFSPAVVPSRVFVIVGVPAWT